TALVAAYTALSDEPAQRSALEALVRLSPGELSAHRALGRSYDAAGRRDDAIAMLTRADALSKGADLELRKRTAELHLARAGDAYLSLGRPEEAIAMLRRAVTADTERLDAHRTLAETLRSHGRSAEAAQSYREVVRLAAEDEGAWRALGELCLGLNEPR